MLDQCVRVLQAMIDMAADQGWLATALQLMQIVQMLVQARWHTDPTLLALPHITLAAVSALDARVQVGCLPEFAEHARSERSRRRLRDALVSVMPASRADEVLAAATRLPLVDVSCVVAGGIDAHSLVADEEYALEVTLTRVAGTGGGAGAVRMARLGKPVSEGWWLVLGDAVTGELLALRRLGPLRGRSTTTSLAFFAPEYPGPATLTLYVVSDCHLGLDQQFDVAVTAIEGDSTVDGEDGWDGDENYD